MDVHRTTEIKITLILNEKEAQWLNEQMQNPLHAQSLDHELAEDAVMRSKFFNATRLN